ncbi:hypothetical protein [Streptomyces scopuliridis]|uniref:hypothetical protein n=1 Tax=Streptomyces scopuliridis TaxID=452529 RepID=UPI003419ACE9
MTAPAEELRTAAAQVRDWVNDEPASWAPTAVTQFGPALAAWLDSAAEDAEQIGADRHALAVARAITGGAA